MISQKRNPQDGAIEGAVKNIPDTLGMNGQVKVVVGKRNKFPPTEKKRKGRIQKNEADEALYYEPPIVLESRPISRVLFRHNALVEMIISLVPMSPWGSCDQPASPLFSRFRRAVFLPFRDRRGLCGLAPRRDCPFHPLDSCVAYAPPSLGTSPYGVALSTSKDSSLLL